MAKQKLFMVLLGCRPAGRNVEQHDFFFGIAESLQGLLPELKTFWAGSGTIHIDGWREVQVVDGYELIIQERTAAPTEQADGVKLFFINLGGYQPGKFEEQHHTLLTVQPDRSGAIKAAKETAFFQNNGFEGAHSHIDDKYGVDVDEIYEIEEILSEAQKQKFRIGFRQSTGLTEDSIQLGYLKLNVLDSL